MTDFGSIVFRFADVVGVFFALDANDIRLDVFDRFDIDVRVVDDSLDSPIVFLLKFKAIRFAAPNTLTDDIFSLLSLLYSADVVVNFSTPDRRKNNFKKNFYFFCR